MFWSEGIEECFLESRYFGLYDSMTFGVEMSKMDFLRDKRLRKVFWSTRGWLWTKQKRQLWNIPTKKNINTQKKKGGDGNPYPSYLSLIRKVKVSRPWRTSCLVKASTPSSELVRASSLRIIFWDLLCLSKFFSRKTMTFLIIQILGWKRRFLNNFIW